jgi:hypothetical protein
MKKILFILLIIPSFVFGQGWETSFVLGERGYSVQQTADLGYIISGETYSTGNGSYDVYFIKTDGNGIEQWNKTFGGTDQDWSRSVQQTTDGGYIIIGTTTSFGNGNEDVYLIKTDGNGIEQWNRTFGGTNNDRGCSVQQTTDGGYIITGITMSFGNGNEDVYLIKTDGNGIEQWNKTFGEIGLDWGYSVQQTTDGGYVIAGWALQDIFLIKTDGNGIEQWNKTFGGAGLDWGFSVKQTTDGGYIIAGKTISFGNGSYDVYLIKTDGNGIEQWNRTFGGTNNDGAYSVQQTTDGGYIIAGMTESFGNGNEDVYLIKTDGNGVEQWNQTFGDINDDGGNSVQQTTDGGYVITGWTLWDIYLIKTDGNGNITSTFNIPLTNPNRKLEKVTDILGRESNLENNTPLFYIYDNGAVEKRIIIE